MDMMSIIIAALIVGAVGILTGVLLGVASEKFKVKVNEMEVKIRELLPGSNCGGCGYPGCDGCASAIAKNEAPPSACPVGGEEVAKKISEVVGKDADMVKMVAHVRCAGNCEVAKDEYEYVGPLDCRIATNTPGGGPKGCPNGCLGYGSCVKACPFDAIHIENGIAVVDKDKCKACGKCIAECPRNIIEMVPYDAKVRVVCTSKEFGKEVKAVCNVGCIGCGMCARNCPQDAITVTNNLADIDYEKCTGCGICKEKCPVKIIH